MWVVKGRLRGYRQDIKLIQARRTMGAHNRPSPPVFDVITLVTILPLPFYCLNTAAILEVPLIEGTARNVHKLRRYNV